MELKTNYQKVYETLMDYKIDSFKEGSFASEIHKYYNQIGLKEGWLKPESMTKLAQQDDITKKKNMEAAKDVIYFWRNMFNKQKGLFHKDHHLDIIRIMQECIISFLDHKEFKWLENCAKSQHQQWKRFINEYQKERITPSHKDFRKKNFEQFYKEYGRLSFLEKDQDKLVVAIVTDKILELSKIGHIRWIHTN